MIKRRRYKYLSENSAVLYLKAVAIIFMVFHHLFAFDNFIAPSNNWISIIGNRKLEMTVAIFCKVCVGIFAFITGWFASNNFKKYSFNYRLKKIGRLFKEYWIYCIGFIILGIIISEPLPTLVEFIFNLFGLGTRVFDYGGGYTNVCHAWYVFFYCLTMLITIPVLNKTRQIHSKCKIVVFFILAGASNTIITVYQESYVLPYPYSIIIGGINDYVKYSPVVAAGYWMNENGFDIFNVRYLKYYGIWGVIIPLLQVKLPYLFGMNMGVLYVPIFISCSISFLEDLLGTLKNYEKLKAVIVYAMNILGEDSMDIWFLHSIFFTPLRKLQRIAYFPRVSVLIWIWTLFLCCCTIEILKHIKSGLHKNYYRNNY